MPIGRVGFTRFAVLFLAVVSLAPLTPAQAGSCAPSCASPGIPANCANKTAAEAAVAHVGEPVCNRPDPCAAYDALVSAAITNACTCRSSCAMPGIPTSCANRTAAEAAIARIDVPACNHPELCGAFDKSVNTAIVDNCTCHSSCRMPGIPVNCANKSAAEAALAHIGVPVCNHPELCANYATLATNAITKGCETRSLTPVKFDFAPASH